MGSDISTMAQYTSVTKHEIETITSKMAISEIDAVKILSGGSENTNYLVETNHDKYVVTICEQKSFKEAEELAHLLEHLESHGFNTSKVIRDTDNESVTLWRTKPVLIKRFIDGEVSKDFSSHFLELIGIELGKLHKIKAPEYLPKQLNFGKEKFETVKKYAANTPFDIWLSAKLKYVSPFFSSNLPKAFIHSDVFFNNVIIGANEKSVVIMDFEDAAYYYRVFDLGMVIIGVCSDETTIDFKSAIHILKGYQQQVQLLEIEVQALQAFTVYAGACMTFWRHINFNYIKPDADLSNHYLGLKVLTDYAQNQPADLFLRLIENGISDNLHE